MQTEMLNGEEIKIPKMEPTISRGRILSVRGMVVTALLPHAATGEIAYITTQDRGEIQAIVTGFQEEAVSLAPLSSIQGIAPGAHIRAQRETPQIRIPKDPRGLVLDCLGSALNRESPSDPHRDLIKLPLFADSPKPLARERCLSQVFTGIGSIDLLTPLARGQRIGVFAPAGSGKSTLLGMVARNSDADCIVIGLIGERGREIREFVEDVLGETGLTRSVVVATTSDEPAIRRVLAAYSATAIAEYYRDQGKRVLLILDSLTRVARAMREVGLACGEIPVRHGYPASVYAELPRLLERSGCGARGSITALYSVLEEGDTSLDPMSEEIQSLLDGHVRISRELALRGIRPAIDFTSSVSRLAGKLLTPDQSLQIGYIISMLSRLKRDRDILLLGGVPDPELASILNLEPKLNQLLAQGIHEESRPDRRQELMTEILTLHNQRTN